MADADTARSGAGAGALGRWASMAAAAAAVAYGVPQLLQVGGVLHDPWDRILIFAPSLLLAPCFVVAVAAAFVATPAKARDWAAGALGLAILYAADVSMVYVVQLGAVIPADLAGRGAQTAFAACCRPGGAPVAVDLLGYTYMSLSTLLLAAAYPGRQRRLLRYALAANGALAPLLIGQLAWPWLIYGGAAWLVTFPVAMILLARSFRP